MSKKPVKQLIAGADSQTEFYPKQLMQNVLDGEAGENLYAYLSKFNHINVGYVASVTAAYNAIPEIYRKTGFIITYYINEKPTTKQFIGTKEDAGNDNWSADSYWQLVDGIGEVDTNSITLNQLSKEVLDLIGNSKKVNIVNYPDGEDLTQVDVCGGNSKNEINVLKFADKECNAANFSGLGRVYLRKNLVEVEEDDGTKVIKNVLTQEMINTANIRYIIQYDYDLNGAEITIPEGCILDFQGGKLKNGSINFNKCIIDSKKACFNNIVINGIIGNKTIFVDWFSPYKEYPSSKDYFTDIENDNVDIINNILNSVKSNSTNEQKIIEFGYGIYKFKESIKINYNLTSVVFKGQGIRNTAIVTPNGRNIEFISGAYLCNCVFKDVWFEANGANFYFIIELDKSLPAAMDNIFENVSFYSHDTDDCCFGLSLAKGTSVYHNIFRNILVHKKTGYIFKGVSGLGTVFDNLTDININFATNGTRSDKETTIFGFCKEVTIINSNFTNTNYKSIYFYDNTYQDALGLYLLAINCNFESFHGPFVETGTNTSTTLEFIRTSFVSENWDNYKKDFIIHSPVKLIGIPKNISNYVVSNESTTINKHDTIVESFTAYYLKYSCVDINFSNSKFLSSDFLEVNENNPNIYIESLDKQYIIKKTNQYSADEFNLIFKDFRVPVIYDFNNPPQEFTSIDNCILKLKNPTKDNCTLNLNNISHVVNDNILYNNSIVAVNNNNHIVVQVKHNNNTIDYIFPFETVLIIGGWFVLKPYCEISTTTGKVILGIKSGNIYNINIDTIGNVKCKCVKTGCGLFAFSKRRNNYQVYDSNDIMYFGYVSHKGYIYKCIKSGITAEIEPVYSTDLNSITIDGTAEYLCIGESPIIAPISIYDIDNVTSELFDMSHFGGEYTFEGASNKPVFYSSNGTKYDADGFKHEFTRRGITGNRPTLDSSSHGFQYFDVTLSKPIWWTGFKWVDATGVDV